MFAWSFILCAKTGHNVRLFICIAIILTEFYSVLQNVVNTRAIISIL